MHELIETLRKGDYSCVIRNGVEVRTFTRRGIADLYSLLKEDAAFLKGAFLADKVMGKAAAALAVLGGVRELYTEVISLSALALLREAGVETDFRFAVPFIRNRNGDDWCPLEVACHKAKDAGEVLEEIERFLADVSDKRMA